MLRAFGKQITLSTNKEACRDLTGRRIRHINNEKKLKDFLMRQSELAKRKDAEKKEKAERRRKKRDQMENTHHIFLDPKYDQQKQKIDQDLDDAIQKAAKAERLVMKSKKRKLGAASSSSGPISSADAQQEEESKGKEVTDETVTLPKSTEETRRDEVTKVTAATDETTSTVVQASAASVTVVPVKLVEVKETKKTVDKFKDWMGVGDLDVSSSSSEDDDQPENVPVKSKQYLLSLHICSRPNKIFFKVKVFFNFRIEEILTRITAVKRKLIFKALSRAY